jgi:hypothetical protein
VKAEEMTVFHCLQCDETGKILEKRFFFLAITLTQISQPELFCFSDDLFAEILRDGASRQRKAASSLS